MTKHNTAAGVAPSEPTRLRDQDIEDVWRSVLAAMPEASEREQRIAFAKTLQSARAVEL